MTTAEELFEKAITWLKENYASFRFFTERDVVWTIQKRLLGEINEQALPYRVFNDYPILPGNHRSICTDLAILGISNNVDVVAEFKYEPAHERKDKDIWPSKFKPTVVFWGDQKQSVYKDVMRIAEYASLRKTKIAYSFFIDEGSYFRSKKRYEALAGAQWLDWYTVTTSPYHISVLMSKVQAKRQILHQTSPERQNSPVLTLRKMI